MKCVSSKKIITSGFWLALLALLGVGSISYRSMVRLSETTNRHIDSHAELTVIKDILSTVNQTATDGEAENEGAIASVKAKLKQLEQFVNNEPDDREKFERLQSAIAEFSIVQKQLIELNRRQKSQKVDKLALANRRKALFKRVRSSLADMEKTEIHKLEAYDQKIKPYSEKLTAIFIGGYSLTFALIVAVYSLLKRQDKQRELVEISLNEAKDKLAATVEERTAELTQALAQLQQELSERKQIEEKLKESEDKQKALLNNIPDLAWLKDCESRFIAVNEPFAKFFGLKPEDLVGKTKLDIAPLELANKYRCDDREVINSGQSKCIEGYWIDCSGNLVWMETIKTPIYNGRGEIIGTTGIARDITVRKQAEAALRESEERFRQIAENIRQVFFINSADLDRVIYISPGYEDIWGKTCESLYQNPTSWIDSVHPEDRDRVITAFTRMAQQDEFIQEYRIIRPNGGIRWISARSFALRNITREIYRYVGFAEDITDRKQTEEALRESEHRFRTMADTAPVLIWMSGLDKVCYYFNQVWIDFTGRSLEQEIGNGWLKNVHPEDLQPCIDSYFKAFDAREKFTMEYRLRRFDGEYRWILNTGIPRYTPDGTFVGYIGSCIDISDRKQAEKERDKAIHILEATAATLGEAERRWRSLLENVQLAVVLLDNTGNIEYINPFFMKLVGYTKNEISGKNWVATFLPPHQREAWQKINNEKENDISVMPYQSKNSSLSTLRASGEKGQCPMPYPPLPSTILTKSGEERTIAWNMTLLKNSEGDAIGTMSIGEDITERQVIEGIKDEFISIVSHEIRTPLTAIHASLGLLSHQALSAESEKGQRALQIAAQNAERLVRLVNDILDLERLESSKTALVKQTCNAADPIAKACELMQVVANRAGIKLLVYSEDILFIADPDRIMQVLTNLLSNAIKFSPEGSTISLSVELQPAGEQKSCQDFSYERSEAFGSEDTHAQRNKEAKTATIDRPEPVARDRNHFSPFHSSCSMMEKHSSCSCPLLKRSEDNAPCPTILFKVKDRGRGIPPEKLETIFERFHQVDASDSRKKGGTGLGLAICRSIVQQHGGRIWVESTLNEGSTFYFALPATPDNFSR